MFGVEGGLVGGMVCRRVCVGCGWGVRWCLVGQVEISSNFFKFNDCFSREMVLVLRCFR
jgi:hypothetical protein